MTTKIVFFFSLKIVLNKYLAICVILFRKPIKNTNVMKKYICTVCEYIYDPEQGDPESGKIIVTRMDGSKWGTGIGFLIF